MKLRPTIVSAKTTASADDALAVLSPRTNRTPGDICYSILKELNGPALLAVDGKAGRIYGTTDVDTMSAFFGCYTSLGTVAASLKITPDVNSLLSHWTVVDNVDWPGDVAAFFHTYNRRSLSQVVQWFASDFLSETGWKQSTFLLIDQVAATVLAFIPFDALAVSVAFDESTVAGQTVCYHLAPKVVDMAFPPFE